jgi:hypothetical protein
MGEGWVSCTVRTSRTLFEPEILAHLVYLCLVCDLIDGILAIEQCRRLLQRPVLGLYNEEPQIDEFKCQPANVYELDRRDGCQYSLSSWIDIECNLRSTSIQGRPVRSG